LGGRGLRLRIIGRDGASPELRARCDREGIDFVGEVPRVQEYYRESAVAIVPLLSGSGTRLKILESMALGTPVVSTSLGAQGIDCGPEEIRLADTPERFAAAILDLVDHPGDARRQSV